jgi:hypothetical protein
MIKLTRINEFDETQEDWLISGVLSPWLTLLSGQPKHGKSILAGHMAISLIQEKAFLEREVTGTNHLIAWIGYDPGWKQEVIQRWGDCSQNQIILIDTIRSLDAGIWLQLANDLRSNGVTLLIIDHLYGLAGALGLNDAEHVAVITNLLRPIYEDFGIAVLLIAQAGKGEFSKGRAAHSVAIEGEARALIRISDKKRDGSRNLELISNTSGDETLKVKLSPEQIELKQSKSSTEASTAQRESPDAVRKFLLQADPDHLTSWSGAGRELRRLGFSTSNNGGRSMAKRWEEQRLLQALDGRIVAGDSLIPLEDLTNPYKNKNASPDYLPR